MRLFYKVVLKFESEPEWFGDNVKEVYDILSEIYEMVHVLEIESDRDTKDTMDLMLSEGQRNDIHFAIPVLEHINIEGCKVLADRGYDSYKLIDYSQTIPLSMVRLFFGGRPGFPVFSGGSKDATCSHS